jgi:hypothetical protein
MYLKAEKVTVLDTIPLHPPFSPDLDVQLLSVPKLNLHLSGKYRISYI